MAYSKNLVSVPDLPGIVRTIADTLTQSQFQTWTKKPLLAAGRVQAKAAKANINARKKRGKRFRQSNFKDSSGALKKAVQVVHRKSKGLTPYVVVGINKKISVAHKRGKKTIQRRPSQYAHLLETGFTAVGRIKGQRGRADERWAPRAIKLNRALNTKNLSLESLVKAAQYKIRYLAARRTKVPGNHFFSMALASSRGAAVNALTEALKPAIAQALAKIAKKRGR